MSGTRDRWLQFNGVDGATGRYLWPLLDSAEASETLAGISLPSCHKGPSFGIDVNRLASCGWGVVFANDADPVIAEALAALVELREEQVDDGGPGGCRVFSGEDGYHCGESAGNWLARHGAGPGPVNPARVPYYLLLVGDPEEIPFSFQLELSVQHAVGRVGFQTTAEYVSYVRSVVAAERQPLVDRRCLALWAPSNADDRATALSSEHLAGPLARELSSADLSEVGLVDDWTVESWIGEDATKDNLRDLLGGDKTPALLFTASHGLGFPSHDRRQSELQGALLTQDWPGPKEWKDPIQPEQYFCSADLRQEARLDGLIAFFFACYGAGTPSDDEFSHLTGFSAGALADAPFISHLPQRMLGLAKGGARAVVGHVDRAWGYSFMWHHSNEQVEVFRSTLLALMAGYPVGAAMEAFSQRYGEISTRLLSRLYRKERGDVFDPKEILQLWTATQDAKNYVILGDPAVRLPIHPERDRSR